MASLNDTHEDQLFLSRLNDGIKQAARYRQPKFLGFLDERQALLCHQFLDNKKDTCFQLWGGYEGAERLMLGLYPADMPWKLCTDDFPIIPLTFTYKTGFSLSHRDFLGTLMSLGITRDTLGDILAEDGRCVLLVRQDISGYISSQCCKIGGVGVKITEGVQEPLPAGRALQELQATVASLRTDCIVAALIHASRGRVAELLAQEQVFLNYTLVKSAGQPVVCGDIITVRGTGKFKISALGPPTKKGRLLLKAQKYV